MLLKILKEILHMIRKGDSGNKLRLSKHANILDNTEAILFRINSLNSFFIFLFSILYMLQIKLNLNFHLLLPAVCV